MIESLGWATVVCAVVCPALAALTWWWLPRLPEPPAPEGPDEFSSEWVKPTYAGVAGRRHWFVLTLLASALLGAWAGTTDEPWPWLVWASVGLVLVVVDLATTYLPVRLHRWTAGLTLLGVAVALVRDPSPGRIASTVGGALVATAFFWVVWRVSAQFGFGDVRLAFPLGAIAGLLGWSGWFTALLAGTALGALHGIVVGLWRRRHPSGLGTAFPYGPALWCGPWIALAISR